MTEIHILSVFHPCTIYAANVCVFTDANRAQREQESLQVIIDDICSQRQVQESDKPIANLTSLQRRDFDKVHPDCLYMVSNEHHKHPLASIESSGPGCWFGWLNAQEKNGTNGMYVVTDFFGKDANGKCVHTNSRVIGVFTNPTTAHEIQGKVLQSYGMDSLYNTYDKHHLVELQGFIGTKQLDPEVVEYRYLKNM